MSSKSQRASRPNRFGIGFFSILQIVLLLVALVFLNYISSQNHYRADYSRTADYSLSSATKNYLKSDTFIERKRSVKCIMVFHRSSPVYDRVRALLDEYQHISGNKIELEVIDPTRSTDRAQQFAAAYNLTLVRDLVLIDARPSEETPVVVESATGTPALNPHITLALADEMITYAMDKTGQRRPNTFRGEDLITARLVEGIEGKPRRFLFFADKSRIDSKGENSPWGNLSSTLRYQNIQLTPANLLGLNEIPSDVDGVAIIAPKYDFTDQEIETLESYWNSPRAAFLILLEAGQCPPKLKTFLRSKGVTPRSDRIVTKDATRVITAASGSFSQGIPFLKDLSGQSVVFEGASSSLDVRENADDLMIRKISPVPLISISSGFWGESDFGKNTDGAKEGELYDPLRDNAAPLYIAAAITRGAANVDSLAVGTSRLIVISNTDFLETDRQRAENVDFLASASNWLVRRESLAGLSQRPIGTYKLPLLQAQVSFINRLNLFFAPFGILLIGGIVFSSRRS